MDREKLQRAVELGAAALRDNDLDFYRRVWRTDLEVYRARLRAIGFTGLAKVLDAGSGMGQWSFCLAELNSYVCGVDASPARVQATQTLLKEAGVKNAEIEQQSIEQLCYPAQTFDAVFCYSVLYMTDYRRALEEFRRVLKPQGKLYICSNGLGWYLYNLLKAHNPSPTYKPRRVALRAVSNTLAFALLGKHTPGQQVIIPSRKIKERLKSLGFERIMVGGEGTIKLEAGIDIRNFYQSSYYGGEGVYEILAARGSYV